MNKKGIGYGNPPEHGKFKPGQSGNKKGRPKGRISTTRLLEKHLDAKVTVNIGGKPKKISRREALVLNAINDAFKGSEKIRKQFLDLVLTFDNLHSSEQISSVDATKDQAVVDALLLSYGLKSANSSANKSKDSSETSAPGPDNETEGAQ